MSLDYIPDNSKANRPRPSMPIVSRRFPIYMDLPVRRCIGHLVARETGYEAFGALDFSAPLGCSRPKKQYDRYVRDVRKYGIDR
jgi:hypothetical protein